MALPAGTVTLLFSDIEGSTRLLEHLGDGYADVLDEHRRIVRDAVAAHGGHELRTEGDAFFVVFSRAGDAMRAAVAAQRGLGDSEWPRGGTVRVRIGVHTGEPRVVGNDYVGMDVHRAARICSAAHGGQIVVSDATRRVLAGGAIVGVELRDLGEHLLKDLARPLRLYQVVAGGLSADFPPLRAQERPPSDLPREWELTREAIVGREPELELLTAFVAGRARGAVLALVEGEAGVGKSALWSAAAAHADRAGACVLAARPTAAEATSSYAALDDLVRRVAGVLPRVAQPGRRALAGALLLDDAAPEAEPRLVALGVLSLLDVLAAEAPVVIAVDDWQWLDASSEAVLAFVLRRLAGDRVHIVATLRGGAADDTAAALVRSLPEGRAVEIPLGPLDAQALHRLIHEKTGRWLSPPTLARLHEASRGNALTALELARAEGTGAGPLVTDVRRLLARRVAALSPAARDVVRCVAALSAPTAEGINAGMADPFAARDGVEAAMAAEILERDGERVRFAHPLLATVVEDRTPPDVWGALHRRLAHTVGDVEERARHLALAASDPDATVANALEAAAGQASARGAPATAAELAQRAAELTPAEDHDAAARRRLAAADAHVLAGDGDQARRVLGELIDALPPGATRAAALCRLAHVATDGSNVALAERALAEAGDDDRLVAQIHVTLANNELITGALEAARQHAEKAAESAKRAGDPYLQARAMTELAAQRFWSGEGVQRNLLLEADRLERKGSGPAIEYTALALLGLELSWAGDLQEGRRLLEGELRRGVSDGDTGHEGFARWALIGLEVRAGNLAVADSYASEELDFALGIELSNSETGARGQRALVDAHLGRVESARGHAERALALADSMHDTAGDILTRQVLGFLELSLNDADAAVGWLAPLPARVAGMGVREPMVFGIDPDLAEALVLAGDLDGARAAQARLEALGRELRRPWAVASALRCRGMIAGADDRHDDALANYQASLEMLEQVPQPFERARTLLALGTTQRRANQPAAARATLEAALALFGELGTELWTQRARAEIARLDATAAAAATSSHPPSSASPGWPTAYTRPGRRLGLRRRRGSRR